MGEVKKILQESEEMLDHCLTKLSMTNQQALEYILQRMGLMAHDHAEEVLKKWNDKDVDGELTVE